MPTRRGEPTQFLGDPGEVVGDLREHPNQGAGDQCGGSSALSGVSALDLYAPSVGVSHEQQRVYGIVVPNVSAASPDGRLMENNIEVDAVFVTSPWVLLEAAQARGGLADAPSWIL